MYLFMPAEPLGEVLRKILGPTIRSLFIATLAVTLIGVELLFWETARWFGVVLGTIFLPVTATVAPLYEGQNGGTWGFLFSYSLLLALIPLLRIDRGGEWGPPVGPASREG